MISALKDKRNLILKNRVLRNFLRTNQALSSAFNTWRINIRPTNDDFYIKNANLMNLLNAINRTINQLRGKFFFI